MTPTIRISKYTPNSPLAILGVTLWLGGMGIVTAACISLVLPTPKSYKITLSTVLVVLSFLPLPRSDKEQKFGWALGDWIMRRAREVRDGWSEALESKSHILTTSNSSLRSSPSPLSLQYFGLTVHLVSGKSLSSTASLHCHPNKGGVIVALEPHDVLPYPLFAFNSCLSLVPELPNGHGLMTSIVFSIPFVRHIYTYCRAGDVSRRNFSRHLKGGDTVVFIPGGVQEVILLGDPMDIILYLNKRKGFIKLGEGRGRGRGNKGREG